MNLFTYDTTLLEIAGRKSTFPSLLRQTIINSLQQITVEDMDQLLHKHESAPDNFDGNIVQSLRNSVPSNISIQTNHPISNHTRFNSDIILHTDNSAICIEIEKGCMSRFELDILKMQSFASLTLQDNPQKKVFGAFIVPADNVVANHISGNRNESSFKYLNRLSRMVSEIKPLILHDILFVGYSLPGIEIKKSTKTKSHKSNDDRASYVIEGNPLVEINEIKAKLHGYPLEMTFELRKRLTDIFPDLREKLNFNSRYLAYANGNQSDSAYVYIQKNKLLLDIRVSKEEANALKNHGIKVHPRNNYQCKAGWLTGVSLPHDSDKLDVIIELLSLALES